MKRRYLIAAAAGACVLVLAFALAAALRPGQRTLIAVYQEYLSQNSLDHIYFDDADDRQTGYFLKEDSFEDAAGYLLSLKLTDAGFLEDDLELKQTMSESDCIWLVDQQDELPESFLELYLVDSRTVIICESGPGALPYENKPHRYTLSESFELDRFLSFFDSEPLSV